VVMGRQMIADPELPNKALAGREREIRRCLRCFHCFPGSPEAGYVPPDDGESMIEKVGRCTINPRANLVIPVDDMPKPTGSRKVLVVGGGPAGMQAAITAADRGHQVTLLERAPALGGILKFTDVDVDKQDLRDFKDLLIYEVGRRDIDVRLSTPATPATVATEEPDVVILAVGSTPLVPPIEGIDTATPALAVYERGPSLGRRIVMVGGGLAGCETGLHLAKTGHEVTVVEMLDRAANESYGMYREALLLEMGRVGMKVMTGTKCVEITPNAVLVEGRDGAAEWLEADTVVFALGMRPHDTSALKAAAGTRVCLEAGDCIRAARVDAAVREGFLAAMSVL
jgi:NADPH-dependent 2,4-dienoyl-CoA reductase/sulfur reductase-like enzyme